MASWASWVSWVSDDWFLGRDAGADAVLDWSPDGDERRGLGGRRRRDLNGILGEGRGFWGRRDGLKRWVCGDRENGRVGFEGKGRNLEENMVDSQSDKAVLQSSSTVKTKTLIPKTLGGRVGSHSQPSVGLTRKSRI